MKREILEKDRFEINLTKNNVHELFGEITLFDISMVPPFGDNCRITLNVEGQLFSADDYCFFGALLKLRENHLECLEITPKVNGASIDCYPSNMGSEMGAGMKVYRQTMGKPCDRADLVDTFSDDAITRLASVEEQRAYRQNWFSSLGIKT